MYKNHSWITERLVLSRCNTNRGWGWSLSVLLYCRSTILLLGLVVVLVKTTDRSGLELLSSQRMAKAMYLYYYHCLHGIKRGDQRVIYRSFSAMIHRNRPTCFVSTTYSDCNNVDWVRPIFTVLAWSADHCCQEFIGDRWKTNIRFKKVILLCILI